MGGREGVESRQGRRQRRHVRLDLHAPIKTACIAKIHGTNLLIRKPLSEVCASRCRDVHQLGLQSPDV
ncbi:unnamed protein product, partial [Mycena citricolor]